MSVQKKIFLGKFTIPIGPNRSVSKKAMPENYRYYVVNLTIRTLTFVIGNFVFAAQGLPSCAKPSDGIVFNYLTWLIIDGAISVGKWFVWVGILVDKIHYLWFLMFHGVHFYWFIVGAILYF